jgi:hypothetical protein
MLNKALYRRLPLVTLILIFNGRVMTKKISLTIATIGILSLINISFAVSEKKSLEKVLSLVGCTDIKRTVSNPTKWEKEEFNLQVKQSCLVKFRAKDGLRYKFLVEEESYANEEDAKKRLPRIKEIPPELKEKFGNAASKMHAEYVLREGFVLYNKVYIVSTFTSALESNGDLENLREKIEKTYKE